MQKIDIKTNSENQDFKCGEVVIITKFPQHECIKVGDAAVIHGDALRKITILGKNLDYPWDYLKKGVEVRKLLPGESVTIYGEENNGCG